MLRKGWGVRAMAKVSKDATVETQAMRVQRGSHWEEQTEVIYFQIHPPDVWTPILNNLPVSIMINKSS